MGHAWDFISDYETDPAELAQPELKYLAAVEAAWLHHRFTQIHPFQDGNGRIARALATLVFVKAGWLPLVVRNEGRVGYLDALELADRGDLRVLVRLFAGLQKDELLKALSMDPSVVRAPELWQATL